MSGFMMVFILLALAAGMYVFCHNTLMSARFRVDEGWSGIIVQLKRRHALVPNLVQAARTALGHEQAIVERIVTARTQALEALAGDARSGDKQNDGGQNDGGQNGGAQNDEGHAEIAKAEAGLSRALGQFLAYTEDNPELSANENLVILQKQLEETEDQVAAARRIYNGNVQAYNTRVASIPWNLVAGLKKMKPSRMFALDDAELETISRDPSLDALAPPRQDRI